MGQWYRPSPAGGFGSDVAFHRALTVPPGRACCPDTIESLVPGTFLSSLAFISKTFLMCRYYMCGGR